MKEVTINLKLLYELVQGGCWANDVLSDTSEMIANSVVDEIRFRNLMGVDQEDETGDGEAML